MTPESLDEQEVTNIGVIFVLALFAYVGAWRHEKIVRQKFFDLHKSEERFVAERMRRMKADRRVLGSMCDAIVSLDSEHRLATPCPKLAALLLKQSPLPEGTPFVDVLMNDDERTLFSEFLRILYAQAANREPSALEKE